jgi:transmembrane sensor
MNKVTQFYSKDDIQEQACLWVTRMDRGLSEQEQKDLSTWTQLSNHHHTSLFEVASHWDNLSILNELGDLFPLEAEQGAVKKKWHSLAMAASIALVSIVLTSVVIKYDFSTSSHSNSFAKTTSYSTIVGEQARYTLPDGSNIQLNTNSTVNIDFTETYRKLTLVRGEALFDVSKDKHRPFIVSSGKQNFTALGTIFNVQKTDENNIELLVTEGRVLLSKGAQKVDEIIFSLTNSEENLLGDIVTSGQKAVVTQNNTLPVEQISLENIQRDLAWQQGMLIFNGEPLSKALDEVSRYNNKKFKITDKQLLSIPISGYFRTDDLDDLLLALSSSLQLTATNLDEHTIVLSKAND